MKAVIGSACSASWLGRCVKVSGVRTGFCGLHDIQERKSNNVMRMPSLEGGKYGCVLCFGRFDFDG
jgi:hypothetical protein